MLSLVSACTPTEGRRRLHTVISDGAPGPGGRLQVARPQWPLAALRAAGNCSPLGVLKADTGERAEEMRSPGGHAHPQAQVLLRRASLKLTPSPPNSFSLLAGLPHFSFPIFVTNPLLLPTLTCAPTPAAAAAAERGARRPPGRVSAERPRNRARARVPGGPGRGPKGMHVRGWQSAGGWWSREAFRGGGRIHGDSGTVDGQM